jgi:hypothetical protein
LGWFVALTGCPSTVEVTQSSGDPPGVEPPGEVPLYAASPPPLDKGYFDTYEILPGVTNPLAAAIAPLEDGRFVIVFTDEPSPTTVYQMVGARGDWSEPTEIPGLALSAQVLDLALFQDAGRLVLHVVSGVPGGDVPPTSVIATGTIEGYTAVQVAPDGASAQNHDGSVYFVGAGASVVSRVADGALVAADIPFPASLPPECNVPSQLAFRSDGVALLSARCADSNIDAVVTFASGAWGAPAFFDCYAFRPRTGVSQALGATVYLSDPDTGGQYGFTRVTDGAPLYEDAGYGKLEVDPWGRPFLAAGSFVRYSEDGGATWLEMQSVPDEARADVISGAFEIPTGRPVFTDGRFVLWFEPTPGTSWP